MTVSVERQVADLRELDEAEVDPVVVDQLDGVERGDGREPQQVARASPWYSCHRPTMYHGRSWAPGIGDPSASRGMDAGTLLMVATLPECRAENEQGVGQGRDHRDEDHDRQAGCLPPVAGPGR